jgi:hypothetical protein
MLKILLKMHRQSRNKMKSGDLNVILSPDRKRVITIVTEKE